MEEINCEKSQNKTDVSNTQSKSVDESSKSDNGKLDNLNL